MKAYRYTTASGDTVKELDEKVNNLLQEGFELYGNPYFIAPTPGNVDAPICQAMAMTLRVAGQIEVAKGESKARRAGRQPPPVKA